MITSQTPLRRRQLPKLYACATRASLENFRNRTLYNLDTLDAKSLRRLKIPLHECLILELIESGYEESSTFLQNAIYDNMQLLDQDEIGIMVDLRKRHDYLEYLCENLQKIEKERDKGNLILESLLFLRLAKYFMEREKGIYWLAEKIFLVSIAVASREVTDGGRLKCCCKYFYAKFLLDKFPGLDDEEPYNILTSVRNASIGKDWLLYEEDDEEYDDSTVLYIETSSLLNSVLMSLSMKCRNTDTAKSERLARLAEKRARDAMSFTKEANSIAQIGLCQLMMNSLYHAHKSLMRALFLNIKSNNIEGICETKIHLASCMQKFNKYETAEKFLTEMGILAMKNGLRHYLGRALHLLGELNLMMEKPEQGTLYLREAFVCFMGYTIKPLSAKAENQSHLDVQFETDDTPKREGVITAKFLAEAERSRLMAAVCYGQELMESYFNLLKDAHTCSIARHQVMYWKFNKTNWLIHDPKLDFEPCPCPQHRRTPLDIHFNKMKIELLEAEQAVAIIKPKQKSPPEIIEQEQEPPPE